MGDSTARADARRLALATCLAAAWLPQRARADFCPPFVTNVTQYASCAPCDSDPASFSPPCTGARATLSHGGMVPFVASDPCAGRCFFNCTRQLGVPGQCCDGFTGPLCDVDLNACVTSPCDPHARCADLPSPAGADESGRSCTCLPGYAGDGETCAVGQVRVLRQSDFDQGTVRIRTPGVYRLGEDVMFNPNSRFASPPGNGAPRPDQFADAGGEYDRRAYALGFFAAITIECEDVELDLGGFTIQQSVEHALSQRFFAVIELADAPFPYAQGPHNFTNTRLRSASRVSIHSGTIGLSSHHSIHGNNVSDVTIVNVTMRDFEVAGVSINGGRGITVRRCSIGPSRTDVPVNGLFSTGHFIRPYVVKVLERCPTASIELNRVQHSGQAILRALDDIVNRTFDAVVCGNGQIPAVVNNLVAPPNGRPDGSAIYGIVLHNQGTHTNGFEMERNNSVCLDVDGEIVGMVDEHDIGVGRQRCRTYEPAGNTDIRVEDVRIAGLELNVKEVAALTTMSWNKNRATLIRTAQVDPVGAVYQYEVNIDAAFGSTGSFVGNPISNAQLFVVKHLDCVVDASTGNRGPPCQRSTAPPGTPCMRQLGGNASQLQVFPGSIRQTTLDWAAAGGLYPATDNFVICGGDNMFHVNKGAMGIRIDAGDRVTLRNVEVDTLRNSARPPSALCPATSTVRLHPMQSQMWYTGGDAVGVSLAATVNVDLVGRNVVRNVVSASGNAYGMQIMQVSDFVRGRLVVGSLQTLRGSQTFPQQSASSIYAGRPIVKKNGGPPETQSLLIDRYACIPGDNMEMYSPVDSMDMMMMDDDGPPDPTTMTCRVVVDLEAYPVAPFDVPPRATTDYAATCPTGRWGTGSGGSRSGGTRVILVTFAGADPVQSLSPAQRAELEREALRSVVSRMSDGTTAADCLRTWLTDGPPTFHAEFDLEQVTQPEADLVVSSVGINAFTVNVAGVSTPYTSTSASASASGGGSGDDGDDGSGASVGVVVAVLAMVLVLLAVAVAVRWRSANKQQAVATHVVAREAHVSAAGNPAAALEHGAPAGSVVYDVAASSDSAGAGDYMDVPGGPEFAEPDAGAQYSTVQKAGAGRARESSDV